LANILSQEEVDALLRGIAGGDVDTIADVVAEPSGLMLYDLTSQDRIIGGRMPTFEMMNEKFARLFRTTLSGLLRKVINISTTHTDMVKFAEFLKILPVPTSLHLFKMEPLRGTALIVVESKIIFMLVDLVFGGSGKESFKIEGREFTAIENSIIKKVVMAALADLEKIWHPLGNIRTSYLRSEVNPQFAHVVSPADVVIVANFEVEVEYSSGIISICLPYAMLEPIRERLQAGFQSEQMEVDKIWCERFKKGLIDSSVELSVELGATMLPMRDVLHMKKGDVIPLDQFITEPLSLAVEGVPKFSCHPGTYKGNQAVRIIGLAADNSPEV
jgi:flagellar motor switch protein FliM